MPLDGLFPEALRDRLCCHSRIVLQNSKAQSAETMRPTHNQNVSGPCLTAMQMQGTEPPQSADGKQSLCSIGAVPSQQNTAMAVEGF
jgi:hypothetical protein